MSDYYPPTLDPDIRRQTIQAETARAQARAEAAQRATNEARARRTDAASRFVTKHEQAGWVIADRGSLKRAGMPSLLTPDGNRESPGLLWVYKNNLYRQVQDFPLGLDPARYYPPKAGRIIWWDGAGSLRMYERLPYALDLLAREWAIEAGHLRPTSPSATAPVGAKARRYSRTE